MSNVTRNTTGLAVSPPTPAEARAWRNAVFVLFALSGIGMATWVSRVPAIRDFLEVNTTQMGLLILGGSAGSIVGLLFSSHVLAWLGGKVTILISLSLNGVGLAILGIGAGLLQDYSVAWIGLLIAGLAAGICDVGMNVEGAAVERAIRRTVMPLFHASWSLGTVVGAGLGALAIAAGLSVEAHIGIIAGVMVAGTVIAVRSLHAFGLAEQAPEGSAAKAGGFVSRISIWLEPRTLLIGLIVLGMAFAEGSANDWLALAFVDGRGVDHPTGALLFGVFTAAMTIGRIAGVPVLDRFGRVPVLRGSAVLAIVGLSIVIFVDNLAFSVIGIVLWGLGSALGFPVGMSAAADDPAKAAARVAAVATIGYCAFLVGPPFIGLLGDQFGLLNALVVVLALVVLAGVVSHAARESAAVREPAPVTHD